jgi:hypothetical protein
VEPALKSQSFTDEEAKNQERKNHEKTI